MGMNPATMTPRNTAVVFSPAKLSPVLWAEVGTGANTSVYKDAGTTLAVLNTDTCQQWNDVSGNGKHLTQSSAGNRMSYSTDSGNPSLVSASKRMDIPSIASKTWFVVARFDQGGFKPLLSGPTDNMLIRNGNDIFTGASSYISNGGTIRVDGVSYSSGAVDASYHVFTLEGYAQTAAFSLFYWTAGTGLGSGACKAIIVLSGNVSSGDRASMEAYLKAKYGTP